MSNPLDIRLRVRLISIGCAILFVYGVLLATPLHAAGNGAPLQQTIIPGGTITTDTTWAAGVYVVTGNLAIAPGVTLTLEPGVEVRFNDVWLWVGGHLQAEGTVAQPITFTSSAATPAAGDWFYIQVDGSARLRHCTVAYGGRSGFDMLRLYSSDIQVRDCTIRHSQNAGVEIAGNDVRPLLANTTVRDNSAAAIRQGVNTSPSYSGVSFSNNGVDGVVIPGGGYTVNSVLDGSGLSGGGYVAAGNLSIEPGTTLTVTANTTLAFNDVWLWVRGHLQAEGAATQPITFTSSAATPAAGDWYYIQVDGSASLRHCTVAYGGRSGFNMLRIFTSNVQVRDCIIRHSQNAGVEIAGNDVRPLLANTTVRDNGAAAIRQGVNTSPSYSGVSFSNNGVDGVVIPGGDYSVDSILDGSGLSGGSYVAGGNLAISPGVTLTVTANTTLAFNDVWLWVRGHLQAEGTATQPITFTSSAATPAAGDWYYIQVDGSARLRHCTVAHGGRSGFNMLRIFTSNIQVRDCTVRHSQNAGVEIAGNDVRPLLANTTVRDNGAAAIRQGVNTSPSYSGVSFSNNGVDGVVIPGGTYEIDSTLDGAGLSGGGYVASGNLGINPGTTLTVTANTTLAFNDVWLWVRGHLHAEGTAGQPITFTSSAATPAAGDWFYIQVDGSARLRHCTVAYGGRSGFNMLRIFTSNIQVRDCTIRHSQNAGVEVNNGVLPLILHNRIHDNGLGLRNATANTIVDARRNWWGSASGPHHVSNPNGAGNGVSDGVLFTPWLAAPDPDEGVVGRLLVQVGGPTRVSPGQTTRYAISYANLTDETMQDAVLMAALPGAAQYVSSTGGGIYWPQRDQVFWRLGDLAPEASGDFVIEVRYLWGIPDDVVESVMGVMAGVNQGDSAFDIQPYLDYTPVTLVSSTPLNASQIQTERQTYPALDQLYTQAVADGFRLGSANRLTLDSGDPVMSLTFVAVNQGEARFLRRQGNHVLAITYGRGYYTVQNSSGGLRTNLDTFDIEFLGDWSPETAAANLSVEITAGVCFRNCLLTKLADLSAGKIMKVIDLIMKVDDCAKCAAGDEASCLKCGNNIADAAEKGVPGLGEILDLTACTTDCADPTKRGDYVCEAGQTITACAPTPQGWWDIPGQANFRNALARRYIKWECSENLGMWRKLPEFLYCDYATGERCVQGVKDATGAPCQSCSTLDLATYVGAVPLETDQTLGSAGICRLVNAAGGGCAINETTVRVARDPNEKFGPAGDLLPGQTVNYTITYENEGAGQAFGVYILDELSEDFNDSTLVIHGPGQYITNTRTIFWNIGELAPKGQPGSTGVVSFTAKLRSDLAGGTVSANQAVVHFPSVPEVTPTNAVVNLIQPVVAVPQQVETQAGQSVQIELAGREVSNALLSFAVVESPLGGVLSGTAPNLTYTAATGFSGQDRFTFQVSNGITVSRPAEVTIRVQPSPTDSTPPTILWTEPSAGYQNQPANSQPLFVDDNGALYGPAILAQISEPLDPSTANDQTVSVRAGGQALPLSVHFGEGANQISIRLRQPLQPGTLYTVRLSTGLRDLKGNRLSADYTWNFRTTGEPAQRSLYLPQLSR